MLAADCRVWLRKKSWNGDGCTPFQRLLSRRSFIDAHGVRAVGDAPADGIAGKDAAAAAAGGAEPEAADGLQVEAAPAAQGAPVVMGELQVAVWLVAPGASAEPGEPQAARQGEPQAAVSDEW